MYSFFQSLRDFFERLSNLQRFALIGVLVGGLLGLVGVAYWAQSPDYVLLFGQLKSSEANQIVQTLQQENVPYELRREETAVYVPQGEVHELRLRFAGEGVVDSGTTGYELFDNNTLGMTDFMQQLNKKRALEGELARTITSLKQVESSRVHLVIPERSPFREAQNPPSASVIVKTQGNLNLDAGQIRGVIALVSGAVEGLESENVTVLDTEGNMLSDPQTGNQNLQVSNAQLEVQRQIEEHIKEKGQSMLNEVLGESNAILRVSADMDFTRRISENQEIDPESRTVISEEQLEESTDGADANSLVRNYELSRSTTRTEHEGPDISYLTVSVMLDHKRVPPADGEGDVTYEPYTDQELQEIENAVKNAVGFNAERGDQFSIQQTRFDTDTENTIAQQMREQQQEEQYRMYIRYALMLLGILGALWLIRSTSQRVSEGEFEMPQIEENELAQLGGRQEQGVVPAGQDGESEDEEDIEELVLVDDIYTSKLSPEAKARLKAKHQMFEDIQEKVGESPETTANLIHTWLVEDRVGDEEEETSRSSMRSRV